MSHSTKILDHIIHLTPPGAVAETVEQFRALGFNVIPGGTHADGLTANALVVLADGVYLELISFTHEATYYPPSSPDGQKRAAHWWASKQPGWIDFANLGTTPTIADIINTRAERDGSGAAYLPPAGGGRERPDGKELRWNVTFPQLKHGRGVLPFFCEDLTPRDWRVPADPPSNTIHASTAQGIAHVRLLAKQDDFSRLAGQLTSVIGDGPVASSQSDSTWKLETPAKHLGDTPGGKNAEPPFPRLILSVPRNEAEESALEQKGPGIHEVALWVLNGNHGSIDTPYGKIVWIPLE